MFVVLGGRQAKNLAVEDWNFNSEIQMIQTSPRLQKVTPGCFLVGALSLNLGALLTAMSRDLCLVHSLFT